MRSFIELPRMSGEPTGAASVTRTANTHSKTAPRSTYFAPLPAVVPSVQVRESAVVVRTAGARWSFVVATALPATYSVPTGRKSVTTGLRVLVRLSKSMRSLKQTTSPLPNFVSDGANDDGSPYPVPSVPQTPAMDRGPMVLSRVRFPVPIVDDDVSVTVCAPVSPVPGIGVVVAVRLAVLVNESPLLVGSPPP